MKQHAESIQKVTVFTAYFMIIICTSCLNSFAQGEIEIASSPNPVGSGARALGMGGAFIAIADDATAASWNPGGLIQLDFREISMVGAGFHRIEDKSFGTHSEGNGHDSVSEFQLNYLSAAYPFNLGKFPMIISLNHQHLYDFTREFDFSFDLESERLSMNKYMDYQQEGRLTALGIAYSVMLGRQLSFGFTLNFWDNDVGKNEWEQKLVEQRNGFHEGAMFTHKIEREDQYSFKGFNMNFGVMWKLFSKNDKEFTLGAVFKTPFEADLEHDRLFCTSFQYVGSEPEDEVCNSSNCKETIDMPMSYGIGIAYRHSDRLTIAADFYRTEWDDFIIHNEEKQEEKSAVTGLDIDECDVDPTHQIRVGVEYLFIQPHSYVIPLRLGIFYDPAPAQGSPDDFFGFSVGTGFGIDWFIFDIAYQYRFGNDTGEYMLRDFDFSQDVEEHTVYSSVIIHF
ncbi:OmpP1/FadL family transporter [Desulfonema magnum]|uniref:Outer membrane protein transport protein domain-containing protein n=1 Tax=Desulfonema magnum TaxID=45655 RepID=A0A975BVX5_9BACT|nr:outer membrane protein transport protein [Desulfonema magnum]QTA92268.1 Outer membrane protein transport protein domain-containing protein [Desulfonema magnum]